MSYREIFMRATRALLILFLILGYIAYEQTRSPSVEMNNKKIETIDQFYKSLENYKREFGECPQTGNTNYLAKKLNIDAGNYMLKQIYYFPLNNNDFLIGIPININNSIIGKSDYGDGHIYKGIYFRSSSQVKKKEILENMYMEVYKMSENDLIIR